MADSIPTDAVQGDFSGNVILNYFGRYEMEDNPNAGSLSIRGIDYVMLSTSNDVIFMGTGMVGHPQGMEMSNHFSKILPLECRPRGTVYLPVMCGVRLSTGTNRFIQAYLKISPSGSMEIVGNSDIQTPAPTNNTALINVKSVFLNGLSFNVGDKYYI